MQKGLSSLKHFRKVAFASLMAIFLMAMLPFAIAHSGDMIESPPASRIPTIDGKWIGTEWDDAPQYNITGSGGTGYIRIKYDANFLYIIIDSIWDPTLNGTWGSYEGTYVAFDTSHDGGTAPKTDDYLFYCAYSTWMNAWRGNGTAWYPTYTYTFMGEQNMSTSPNSASPHRIDEMKISLTYVGSTNSTSGFYAIVRDDDSDPDGQGPQPPTAWVEWPPAAGGDPNGWPQPGPDYRGDPCPAPNAWGNLTFAQPAVGGIVTSVDKLGLLTPYIALVAVMVAAIIGAVYARKHSVRKATSLRP